MRRLKNSPILSIALIAIVVLCRGATAVEPTLLPQELLDEAMKEIKFADDDTIRERIAGLKGR